MPKLNKRQIIILAVTVVVAIYGAYDWLKPPAKKSVAALSSAASPSAKTADSNTLLDVAGSLSRDPSAKADAYIIKRVGTDWRGDPFYAGRIPLAELSRSSARAGAPGGTEKKADIAYTGYMKAGNRLIAIINGNEYETGETLMPQGYILRGISPTKVVIEDRRDGTVFEVFLQDFLPD
jgi:hypothetical protein